MKIIVTGAAGFLGSHIVDRLLADGHEVGGIDNLLTGSMENMAQNMDNPRYRFIEADITDKAFLEKLAAEVMPEADAIIHTAAIARTPWTIEDPALSHEVNATGTLNLLELVRKEELRRKSPTPIRFVHSSSCIVTAPFTPYYVSKQAAEEYVRLYPELYGTSSIALRYQNLYGKRQSEKPPHPNVFAALRMSKREHGKLSITGDGSQTRDYTHVSDAVEANILALHSNVTGAFDVCKGEAVSLNDAAAYFDCPIEYVPERKGDIKHLIGDPEPLFKAIGFKAKVSLKDGIADVL